MRTISLPEYILWSYLITHLKTKHFKNRIVRYLSIIYILQFQLPRKFFWRYIRGNSEVFEVDTQDVLDRNPLVGNSIAKHLKSGQEQGKTRGSIQIPQILVSDPNYRYSVGSFRLLYRVIDDKVHLKLKSRYAFSNTGERLTKYLHQWLISFKIKGNAADFDVLGKAIILKATCLKSMENIGSFQDFKDRNRLYL